MKSSFYWFTWIFLLLVGCSTENEIVPLSSKEIAGYVQKGPFVVGTSVTVQELTDKLTPTGRTFATQIQNDNGNFIIKGNFSEEYAEIIASGYYYNEVAGKLSASPITLRTISKLSNKDHVNINILTTLQSPRMQKLINEGKAFETAVTQSQMEVLKAFHIEPENGINIFDQLTITQEGTGNAILLAISSIMQDDRTEAELSEFISKVANDIQDNGILDAQSLKDAITTSSSHINNVIVQENLRKRFEEIGMSNISIPDFYAYLDSNGDGELNGDKPYVNFTESTILIRAGVSTYTLEWTANFMPKVVLPEGCDWITITECTQEKLVFTLTKAEYNRQATCSILSPDNELLKEFTIIQEGSAMYFQITMGLQDMRGKSIYDFFDDKVSEIYIITFNNQGEILFTQKEINPVISYNTYKCCIKLDNKVFDNCTIYTIINSPYDFSGFKGNHSDFRNLKANIDLTTSKNLENFYMGETDNWTFDNSFDKDPNVEQPAPGVIMKRPIAKIDCAVEFINDTFSERVRSITLKGEILYDNGSFFKDTLGDKNSLTLTTSENNQFTTYLYAGSYIDNIDLVLDESSKFYHDSIPGIKINAGDKYQLKLRIDNNNISTEVYQSSDQERNIILE